MRIQVLHLPDETVDGEEIARFALVLDEYAPDPDGATRDDTDVAQTFRNFAHMVGAKDGLVVDRRVEVVENTATQKTVHDIVLMLDDLITKRLDQHVAARPTFHFQQGGETTSDRVRLLTERTR
ncbi:hypothetical protein KBX50_05260 [Micromonospora sp. C51]|uniref:hypothetical protein n=1 Tax=Micromonospora sp. C51 TaxID=2824879 RepID=UPI001B371A6E|nr:hypothetical protein [Micromonospora sp. C51]MBQ1047867.1 hypothetical protein [Micromonospora sp. C51]